MRLGDPLLFLGLLLTGILAGAVNAIAGGGPILTLGGLTVLGIDPRIASITSTVALSPGQLVAGAMSSARLSMRSLTWARIVAAIIFAMLGGVAGALLLLETSAGSFRALVPWLVLFATVVYAVSGGPALQRVQQRLPQPVFLVILLTLGVYGGYYGGGNSFLVLALLAFTGLSDKQGVLAKNVYVAAINAGAVTVFLVSSLLQWQLLVPLAAGGMLGSAAGMHIVDWIRPTLLRPLIIAAGLILTAFLLA